MQAKNLEIHCESMICIMVLFLIKKNFKNSINLEIVKTFGKDINHVLICYLKLKFCFLGSTHW